MANVNLGSRKIARKSNEAQAVKDGENAHVTQNENEFESNGVLLGTENSIYPSAHREVTQLNFGQVTSNQSNTTYEEVTQPQPQTRIVQQQQPQQRMMSQQQQQPQQVPAINAGTLFSTQEISYEYQSELITNATEIESVSDSSFLLDYVYEKEKEVGATLLVEAYGVSDHIFESSETHEIIYLNGERYFSNKKETLDKDRLDAMLADIAKALSTVGFYDLPLIKKHTFSGKEGDIKCIKALSINTFEFNAIMGLNSSFETMSSSILEKEGNIFMRFQKS